MTGEELINETLADGVNVEGDGTFDYAEASNDRLRALRRGQAIINDFWVKKDWLWRRQDQPQEVNISADDIFAPLPGDFSDAGDQMSVVNKLSALPVRYKDAQTVQMALAFGANGRRSGPPRIYTISSSPNEEFGILARIQFAPKASQSYTLLVSGYNMNPPEFLDDDTPLLIPEKYHRTVILRLMKREFMKVDGDARDMQELKEIEQYIADSYADEVPRHAPKRSERYGRRRLRSLA